MNDASAAVREICSNLYTIGVPLPKTPLKMTNAYLLRGKDRDLLIDTAFNDPMCLEAMLAALADLQVDMARTDIFLTHLHSDHCGLVQRLAAPSSRIFVSEADGMVVRQGQNAGFWDAFKTFYIYTGLQAGGHVTEVSQHPGFAYAPEAADNYTHVGDGDVLEVGDFRLRCVLTKGHTRGHLCLYEPHLKVLFSGDHILGSITPNITQTGFDHDALGEFLHSLDLVDGLDVDVVLPGHRKAIEDSRARTAELRRHHERRLAETLDIVGDGRVSAVDVARKMQWSLTIKDWDAYPPAQKLFSAAEALAHLHHLAMRGELTREEEDGIVLFRRAEGRGNGRNE
ncbi:MAG: MBL fold metallo-hydrolase [Planctomycetaceae bacterium]|nr:MBL fold metallo-hydrolase [Planctomycetaceae bacterium]